MKSIMLFMVILAGGMTACKSTQTSSSQAASKEQAPEQVATADNSRTSLDWPGVYNGTVPCADCEGIETVIKINDDLSFEFWRKYKGKGDSVYIEKGNFEWNEAGSTITLMESGVAGRKFHVGENQLMMLDRQGNKIEGALAQHYNLSKIAAGEITGKHWQLVELLGQPVEEKGDMAAVPFLVFDAKEMRVSGSGGCNRIFGPVELKEYNRIRMSGLASTMMACPNMETEQEFMKVLETADNYTIVDGVLSLNKARMAPMAKLKWVYLK